MSSSLDRIHAVCHRLRDIAAKGIHLLHERLREAWRRHLALMDDEDSYRAQVVAGVAAVVAVFEVDPRLAALLAAVLGLHAAAYGHSTRPLRPRSVFGDDDEGWDPFR